MNLIYQVNVGTTPAFYQVCIDSVARYCHKYDIHHIVQQEPILKIAPLNNQRKRAKMKLNYLPIFEKENAFNYLSQYEKICIVDSDIYIRDIAPNIFNEINDEVFAGVIEEEMPLTDKYRIKVQKFSSAQYEDLKDVMSDWTPNGVPFFNMGLMLFTNKLTDYLNGETPEQFIRRKEFEKFVNGEGHHQWSTDQTLLNYWVRKTNMPTKRLSWKWNALFKAVQDNKLPQSYFIHFFLGNNLPQKGREIPNIIKNLSLAKNIKGHG